MKVDIELPSIEIPPEPKIFIAVPPPSQIRTRPEIELVFGVQVILSINGPWMECFSIFVVIYSWEN